MSVATIARHFGKSLMQQVRDRRSFGGRLLWFNVTRHPN